MQDTGFALAPANPGFTLWMKQVFSEPLWNQELVPDTLVKLRIQVHYFQTNQLNCPGSCRPSLT